MRTRAMHGTGRFVTAKCSLVAFACLVLCAPLAASENQTAELIFQAWRQRHDRVNSVRLVYDVKTLYPRGSIYPNSLNEVNPEQDTWVDSEGTVTMANGKLRFSKKGQIWCQGERQFRPSSSTSVVNGSIAKNIIDTNGSAQGDYRPANTSLEHRMSSIGVIASIYKPLDPTFHDYDPRSAKISPQLVLVDGVRCVEAKWPEDDGSYLHVYYLDPRREYLPIRCETYRGKDLYLRKNIWYSTDPIFGWKPTEWDEYVAGDRAKKARTSRTSVRLIEIDSGISASDFDIVFPEGMRVYDFWKKTSTISNAHAEQFSLQLPPDPEFPAERRPIWVWIVAGLLAGTIVLVAFRLRQRRLRGVRLANRENAP